MNQALSQKNNPYQEPVSKAVYGGLGSSAAPVEKAARTVAGSAEDPRPIWVRWGHEQGEKIGDKIREYQGKPTVQAEATQKAIDNLKLQTELNRIAELKAKLRKGN